ncbi:MAG TPA: DUF6591 domain-containing protein [Clostridia bacterium]|nr:DUF6591 domain-containing protein [Clostridia bacterium]
MLRRFLLLSVSIVVLLSFVGCGFKQKTQGKLAEKLAQGVLNKIAGDDVDIDLDLDNEGGGFKVNLDGEEAMSFGETEWPKGQAADLIPQFSKGKITYAVNSNVMAMLLIEGVELDDFESYYETVQGQGYTENTGEMSMEESKTYYASKEDGKSNVSITYNLDSKEMMITVGVDE